MVFPQTMFEHFFIATALAQASTPPADPMKGLLLNLPIFAALFALFYFGIIRPQRNQQKKHQELLKGLSKGQEVVTSGGIIGRISAITERIVTLEVDEGTEIKILRSQVQGLIKDGAPV
jgi:preprotein translocase subunit YajC